MLSLQSRDYINSSDEEIDERESSVYVYWIRDEGCKNIEIANYALFLDFSKNYKKKRLLNIVFKSRP